MRRHFVILLLLLSCVSSAVAQQATSNYPAKTVRVIVPYPPGGGNDIIGRAIADELTRRMGQTFFVDNRPGGSTAIGAETAARAPADGYHLFVASQTTFATVPNFKTKLPYDPVRDFEPVSLLAIQPYLIVVHPSLPATNIKQFIALAKARPGQITAGASGGTSAFLAIEMLKTAASIDVLNIAYKGAGAALNDVIAGHVTMLKMEKQLCDYLVVALQVDPTIDRPGIKNKPVQSIVERHIQLAACRYVDEVVVYSTEQDLVDLLLILPVDVRILGVEYEGKRFSGDEACWHRSIEIVYNGRDHSFSSSSLRKRVAEAQLMNKLNQ